MKVTINDKIYEFGTAPSLVDVLNRLDLKSISGIAIAVNENIIQKAKWSEYIVNENDRITIIKATQGG